MTQFDPGPGDGEAPSPKPTGKRPAVSDSEAPSVQDGQNTEVDAPSDQAEEESPKVTLKVISPPSVDRAVVFGDDEAGTEYMIDRNGVDVDADVAEVLVRKALAAGVELSQESKG